MKDELTRSTSILSTEKEHTPHPERSPEEGFDLLILWTTVLRRRKVVMAVFLATLGLAILYLVLKTPRYEAVGDIAVRLEGADALSMGNVVPGADQDQDVKLETEAKILGSASLAWDVISHLRMDQKPVFAGKKLAIGKKGLLTPPGQPITVVDPIRKHKLVDRFQEALKISVVPRTTIIEVRFRSPDRDLAVNVVNYLTTAYVQRNFRTRYEATQKASVFLQEELDTLRSDVETAQNRASDYQKKEGIIGTDENNNLTLAKLDDLSKQLTDAEADRITKEARYRIAKSGNAELIGSMIPDSVLPVLRRQDAELRDQLADAQTRYGRQYPKVVQLSGQLKQVDTALQKESVQLTTRFENEYQASLKSESEIRASFDREKQTAYKEGQKFREFGIMRREAEASRDLYEDLLTKLREAGVMAGLKSTNIDVVDEAAIPPSPVEPNVPAVALIGLLGGAILAMGAAAALENLDQTITTPEQAESVATLPSLGVVPAISNGRNNGAGMAGLPALVVSKPRSEFAESFRSIRTSLLLSSAGGPPKTILITSSTPGEGKSTFSTNLAATFARAGSRVLLVDADLRRGTLNQRFNLPATSGLSGALSTISNWRDNIQEVKDLPGLSLLCGGSRPPNPAELLGSHVMAQLVQEWKTEFDVIVVDSPPALVVTDAVLLSPLMDGVLLLARAQQTHRNSLLRTRNSLIRAHARVLGVVVNGFDKRASYSYYGSDLYGNYGSYYEDDGDKK